MLPGDPSLILTTSATLTDKAGFVKAASAAVASVLSKPEAYVAVCVTDAHEAMSFGGTTEPCALGCVYSIGQINQENNGALTAQISQLLEKHGGGQLCALEPATCRTRRQRTSRLVLHPCAVPDDRIYLNFFDVPRANWSAHSVRTCGLPSSDRQPCLSHEPLLSPIPAPVTALLPMCMPVGGAAAPLQADAKNRIN